jgi:hypothetical protein
MHRLTDLPFLFRIVALVELTYGVLGLVPPRLVTPLTGWVLNADGHWITKLLAVSLFVQGWIAWTLRDSPHIGVAQALAAYQFASATTDWVMWLSMANEGIFATTQARVGVVCAIATHYLLGVLIAIAIRSTKHKARTR